MTLPPPSKTSTGKEHKYEPEKKPRPASDCRMQASVSAVSILMRQGTARSVPDAGWDRNYPTPIPFYFPSSRPRVSHSKGMAENQMSYPPVASFHTSLSNPMEPSGSFVSDE